MPIIEYEIESIIAKKKMIINLSYWCTEVHHDELRFINGRNRKMDQEKIKKKFYKNLDFITESLSEELINIDFDCVLSIPSSKPYSKEILESIKKYIHFDFDISSSLHLNEPVDFGANLEKPAIDFFNRLEILELLPQVDLSKIDNILFVDDVFYKGRSLISIIEKFRDNGLNDKCKFFAAVPLFAGEEIYEANLKDRLRIN